MLQRSAATEMEKMLFWHHVALALTSHARALVAAPLRALNTMRRGP
ncbi:MAG: hypothetical protein L0H23_12215 [Luteimonas sp.]|nr:hypothetical protein [Luteimonas sp.]